MVGRRVSELKCVATMRGVVGRAVRCLRQSRKALCPGLKPRRDLHDELDEAVRAGYGMKAKADVLAFLLDLNHQLAAAEKAGNAIVGPGLPSCVKEPAEFIPSDCVQPPLLS